MTWLIRADDSVRYCTGGFDTGYLRARELWQSLLDSGHEIGWHMHLMSRNPKSGRFGFDPDPGWLPEAYESLSRHVVVRTTRIGWDYGSNLLFQRLDELGIRTDFSALPGNLAWFRAGEDTVVVDWLRCPTKPYHPSVRDYQSRGSPALQMLEVPITQFRNSPLGWIKRLLWRLYHGRVELRGLDRKTSVLTKRGYALPEADSDVLAFHFHPEELTPQGIRDMLANISQLKMLPGLEFLTASAARPYIVVGEEEAQTAWQTGDAPSLPCFQPAGW
jgi:hypothetical protein